MRMPSVGEVVALNILDHARHDEETAYDVLVYGKVVKVTKDELILDVWHPNEDDYDREKYKDQNSLDSYAIVRAAIVGWWPLRKGRRIPHDDS